MTLRAPTESVSIHRRKTVHALFALPLLGLASSGCTVKTIHLEEKSFLPSAVTPLISDQIQRRNVQLPVEDGVVLRGWHLQHPNARALLIYFFGNGDNAWAYSRHLHEIAHSYQLDVLALDYRGNGASSGEKRFANLRNDALRIYDELALQIAEQRGGLKVLTWGYSMGSLPAIHLAANRSLSGLAVMAGVSDFPDVRASIEEEKIPWYAKPFVKITWDPVFEQRPQPVDEIANVHAPIFIFHGEADETLPVRGGDRLNEAAKRATWKQYIRAPGVRHGRLPLFNGPAREGLEAWINVSLKPQT